jgi:hypothetical protein
MFLYNTFSQQGYSSTKYSASKDIPVQNIQSARMFQYKNSVSKDIPVQNIQPARIFQYKIFSHERNLVISTQANNPEAFLDSILNPQNAHYTRDVMTNIRLACAGGGKMVATISWENKKMTEKKFNFKHGHANETTGVFPWPTSIHKWVKVLL